jgi:hypothetical protein
VVETIDVTAESSPIGPRAVDSAIAKGLAIDRGVRAALDQKAVADRRSAALLGRQEAPVEAVVGQGVVGREVAGRAVMAREVVGRGIGSLAGAARQADGLAGAATDGAAAAGVAGRRDDRPHHPLSASARPDNRATAIGA